MPISNLQLSIFMYTCALKVGSSVTTGFDPCQLIVIGFVKYSSSLELYSCRCKSSLHKLHAIILVSCTCTDMYGNCCFAAKEGSIYLGDASEDTDYSVGRIQIFYESSFGYIHHTNIWDDDNIKVVCRQLGYYTGGNYSTCPDSVCNATNCVPTIWDVSIDCNGNEARLMDCVSTDWKPYDCSSSFYATGVSCAGNHVNVCLFY